MLPQADSLQNSQNLMQTRSDNAGFITQTIFPDSQTEKSGCFILNVRGVYKLTIVMKEQLDDEMVFKIAPEKWIMTRWSAYVIGGVVVLNFLLFIICRPKCW